MVDVSPGAEDGKCFSSSFGSSIPNIEAARLSTGEGSLHWGFDPGLSGMNSIIIMSIIKKLLYKQSE